YGIYLNASNNLVEGNIVGLNAAGTAKIGNTFDGVFANWDGNTVGGTAAGAGNVISGNGRDGIGVTIVNSMTIQGNFVGTDINGTAALGNPSFGVDISNSGGALVGGSSAAARNIASGNGQDGIIIRGNISSAGNTVQNNYAGTDVTGTVALGNGHSGI